jgi:flagellar basal-body rod protein FlgG
MIRALWTASTGMKAKMTAMDVIANNLANVGTTAFKKSRADFQDLLYQTLKAAGESTGPDTENPVGQQIGAGTKLAAVTKEFSQGSLTRTDRDLDVAIMGEGFFTVQGIDGEDRYTRDGTFELDESGNIVTPDGLFVKGAGAIPVNARAVNISQTGQVSYIDETGQQNTVGQIQIAQFVNPSGLSAMGGNLYMESPSSGPAQEQQPGLNGSGTLQQRYLELSNVNIVQEMVDLISNQRAYEANSKMIKSSDQMLQTANQLAR